MDCSGFIFIAQAAAMIARPAARPAPTPQRNVITGLLAFGKFPEPCQPRNAAREPQREHTPDAWLVARLEHRALPRSERAAFAWRARNFRRARVVRRDRHRRSRRKSHCRIPDIKLNRDRHLLAPARRILLHAGDEEM